MTVVKTPSAGAVQDAVRILREGFHSREADAVSQMLTQYWSEEWPEAMKRRPDHVSEELWVKWRLDDEIFALRSQLAEAFERIEKLNAQRHQEIAQDIESDDAALGSLFRRMASEFSEVEAKAHRHINDKFRLAQELRQEQIEGERFRQLAVERGEQLRQLGV